MFFKNYFNGVAEALDAKYRSYYRFKANNADVGELCELFIKEVLIDFLDDHYKIFRGGNIINSIGKTSSQLDIVITNKNALKIFGDKGIYPIETVTGIFSITSNLTSKKFSNCIVELSKIPKSHPKFKIDGVYDREFEQKVMKAWESVIPFSCIFGFKGTISDKWVKELNNIVNNIPDHSILPYMVIINKKAIIEKFKSENDNLWHYELTPIDNIEKYGEWLSRILYRLYDIKRISSYLIPMYEYYFTQDY